MDNSKTRREFIELGIKAGVVLPCLATGFTVVIIKGV